MCDRQEQVLQYYASALDRCKQMLAHALQGAWEDLLILQGAYVDDIEQLSIIEQDIEWAPASSEQKRGLLIQIRATEDQVRGLLDARMNELSQSMAQSRNQRDVQKAYETS